MINKTIKSVEEIKGILDTINTEDYSLVNYVWTEYGFHPVFLMNFLEGFLRMLRVQRLDFVFLAMKYSMRSMLTY